MLNLQKSSDNRLNLSDVRDYFFTLNVFAQCIFIALFLSGDIKTNPGPNTENFLDIIHLNIRSIR